MEKLIYVLVDANERSSGVYNQVAEATVPAVRAAGGRDVALLLPDCLPRLESENPGRIIGDFRRFVAHLECWLPSADARAIVEDSIRDLADEMWGYVVTESTLVPCPHHVADGEQVPGISQLGYLQKPNDVSIHDFHVEWSVHSEISNDLHPDRDSYDRNAVARVLEATSPPWNGMVIERFPSLELFLDDEQYFGDPAVVQKMIEHLASFYDFESAWGGAASEYRWR